MKTLPRILRTIPVIAATLAASGCSSWTERPLGGDPLPSLVRVETTSESRIELIDASLEGDSILTGVHARRDSVVRLPLREVRSLQARSLNAPTTTALLIPLALAGAIAFIALNIPGA